MEGAYEKGLAGGALRREGGAECWIAGLLPVQDAPTNRSVGHRKNSKMLQYKSFPSNPWLARTLIMSLRRDKGVGYFVRPEQASLREGKGGENGQGC
jgi:hypothetical protein